nr:hypothetical protein [uncultured Methanobacterium sp.]
MSFLGRGVPLDDRASLKTEFSMKSDDILKTVQSLLWWTLIFSFLTQQKG